MQNRLKFLSYLDVFFWAVMVGVGETFISAFTLTYGFSERYSGIVSVLPLGIASLIQVFSPNLFKFFKKRRQFVVFCTACQAICLFLLLIIPHFTIGKNEALVFVLTLYWFFGLSAGPPWNAWIVSLISKEDVRNFFAKRGVINQVVLVFTLIIVGPYLTFSNGTIDSFFNLFAIAGVARVLSTVFLYLHPDDEHEIIYHKPSDLRGFKKWLSNQNVVGIVILIGFFRLGVGMASSYFTPYFLTQLKFSYTEYTLAILAPFVSRAMFFQISEKVLKKIGIQLTLFFNLALIASLPTLWTFEPGVSGLIFFQLLSGLGWGGFEYALLFRQIEDFNKEERSRVLTWLNFVIGLSSIVGVLIGSQFLGKNPSIDTYKNLFYCSSVVRVFPILLVFLIDWKSMRTTGHYYFLRVIGVRPNKGPEVRPILYADDEK